MMVSSSLTVVMYHYVRELKLSRYPKIKGLDVNLFEEQVKFLLKHYEVLKMEEVIDCLDKDIKLPNKSVLLSFDDAYLDHYNNVFPILDAYGVQGSFYVPVQAIREHKLLDVNKIHFLLAVVSNVSFIVDDLKMLLCHYQYSYKLETFDYYYDKLAKLGKYDSPDIVFIKKLLQVELVEELRIKITSQLFEKYVGVAENAFSRELYMNEIQLKHMIRNGMHVGCHGYNHYWWNRLPRVQVEREITLSLEFLSSLGVDMDKWTACYPYGSYDQQAIDILEEKGCKLALTTDVAVAQLVKSKRFVIPRLNTNDLPKDGKSQPNCWY